MNSFLVSFTFHTTQDAVFAEMSREPLQPQQTSIFIRAADENTALHWGQEIASTFMASINNDAGWSEAGHACWIEQDLASAGWEGAEGYLQTVRVGEYPNYERMTRDAYIEWLEQHGEFDA